MSPKWLLDPDLQDRVRGIMVEVRGSYIDANGGWHKGECEGKEGIVLSVLNTNNSLEPTARVRFFDPVDPLQPILQVPITYLWPVHPKNTGDGVIILAGVQGKGQEATVEAIESTNLMVLTTKATFLVIDSPAERLVRIRHVDEVGNLLR